MKRWLRTPFTRIVLMAAAAAAGSWAWGRVFEAAQPEPGTVPPAKAVQILADRQPALAAAGQPAVVQEVDYTRGPEAAWYPRDESPILHELVQAGKLPPVAERVGAEPLVLNGPDGAGLYGGIWSDAVTWESECWDRMNKYNAAVMLVRWSPSGYPIRPHVAKSWDVSEDQRIWTFHLRRGMRWSDGAPFTADDFDYWYRWEFTYLRGLGYPLFYLETRLLRSGQDYGRLEKVDAETVRFVFPHPNPFFLELLASTGAAQLFAPRHYLEKFHPRLGDPDRVRELMRRGHFDNPNQAYINLRRPELADNPELPRINAWIYRRYRGHAPYRFVRNPYYWAVDGQGRQLPYIDQVTIDVMTPDLLAQRAAAGGFPGIFASANLRLSNYGLLMGARERSHIDVRHYFPGLRSIWTIIPNINRHYEPGDAVGRQKAALLDNATFRQALSLAINRRAIVRAEFLGFGEPAQTSPGPGSPFHSEALYHAFTDYDPARANALLDSLDLTRRDADGYRTLPDGSPMVWFIPYRSNITPGPAQFVTDDWAAVGIHAVFRQVSDGYHLAMRMASNYDMTIHGAYGDFIPLWDPSDVPPTARLSPLAPVWGTWYENQFNADGAAAMDRATGPPPGHPIREAYRLYESVLTAPSREVGIARHHQLLALAARELWTIAIASPPPAIAVVRDDFRNVPQHGIVGNVFHTPLNLGVETFYFEHPELSPGARVQIKEDLLTGSTLPSVAGADEAGSTATGRVLGRVIRYGLVLVVIAGAVGLGLRHPFAGRRLLLLLPMLLVISIMTFTIIQLPPGDIIETRLLALEESGSAVSGQEIARIRAQFHLDEPVVQRYLHWVGLTWFTTFAGKDRGLLQGDLGLSMIDPRRPQPVNELVGDRLLLTVILSLGTILFTWSLALPIGVYSAVRQYSPADHVLTFIGFVGMSVPGFLLALLVMYWGGRFLGLDLTGLFSPDYATRPEWTWGKVLDLLKHIWVPLVVLGVEGTAAMIRIMRGNLLDELRKPYVQTARAKGMRPLRLILKYPVRIAVNPFVSTIGSLFPELISGGAVVSVVLGLPTVGPLMLDALLNEDVYLAGSMLVVLSLLGILGTLGSDLLLMWLDPRIRMEGRSR